MSQPDPLLALRQALSTSATIHLLAAPPGDSGLDPSTASEVFTLPPATHFSIPSASLYLSKLTPTRLINSSSQPHSTYDLQALLFLSLSADEGPGAYLRKARDAGVTGVPITERKSVLDWLMGRTPLDALDSKMLGSGDSSAVEASTSGVAGGTAEASTSAVITSGDSASASTAADEPSSSRTTEKRPAPSSTATASAHPVEKKARYQTNKVDLEAVKKLNAIVEGPLYATGTGTTIGELKTEKVGAAWRNRETVLRGDRVNNFESARLLAAPRIKLTRDEQLRASGKDASAAASSSTSATLGKQTKKKPQHPIVIVSPSSTALLNMFNVKQFLEESVFEAPSDARLNRLNEGRSSNADFVTVDHVLTSGKKMRFYVVDGVEALSKFGGLEEAWERVVCVMTTGQEWQFRPYKWSEPKQLFHHVKGFYVQWTTDPVNTKVRAWNVSELRVDPKKRHIDKSVAAEFWRIMESWMVKHKYNLMP